MKKIKRTEFLAAVAIITSATVLQIREHMRVPEAPSAQRQAAQFACDVTTHRGLVLAACEPTREAAPAGQDRATQHLRNTSKLWV